MLIEVLAPCVWVPWTQRIVTTTTKNGIGNVEASTKRWRWKGSWLDVLCRKRVERWGEKERGERHEEKEERRETRGEKRDGREEGRERG